LTLLGVERFARAIRDEWGTAGFGARIAFEARRGLAEADAAAGLVAALYANFDDFPIFAELTMLYFAPPATRRPLAGSAAGPEPVRSSSTTIRRSDPPSGRSARPPDGPLSAARPTAGAS